MIIEDSNYTYMALPTDTFNDFMGSLMQALVSLKRDEFGKDDGKIRRAEYIIANILNDSTDVETIVPSAEQTLRWFFNLETESTQEETSEES